MAINISMFVIILFFKILFCFACTKQYRFIGTYCEIWTSACKSGRKDNSLSLLGWVESESDPIPTIQKNTKHVSKAYFLVPEYCRQHGDT